MQADARLVRRTGLAAELGSAVAHKENERFPCGRSNRSFDPRKAQDKPLHL